LNYGYQPYVGRKNARKHYILIFINALIIVAILGAVIWAVTFCVRHVQNDKQKKIAVKESYSVLYSNKNYIELIEKMDGELRDNPLQPEFLVYRGFSYYLLGEAEHDKNKQSVYFSLALADLRKVPIVYSGADLLGNVYFCIGKIYYHYGKGYYNQSIEYLNRAIKCGNERIDLLYVLSLVYSYIGEYEKANQILLRSQDLEKNDLALLSIGINCYRMGKMDEAIKYLQETADVSAQIKNKEKAMFTLGMICFEQGKYEKALHYYDKTIELNENNAEAYFQRGEIYYLYYHDNIKARAQWRKTIEIDPGHLRAGKRL
jgi:tetratricopeptide (TPR) repeat protein